MTSEVTPPVTLGFLISWAEDHDLSGDLVITDANGVPFRGVSETVFEHPTRGGQAAISLKDS